MQMLEDRKGALGYKAEYGEWQEWSIIHIGGGLWTIRSHLGNYLSWHGHKNNMVRRLNR